MPYKTPDTAFATWLAWKKRHVPIKHVNGGTRIYFLFKDLDEEKASELRFEYESSEIFEFHVRYKALTQRVREG